MAFAWLARFTRLGLCLLVAAAAFTGFVLREPRLGLAAFYAVCGSALLAGACSGLNQIQERSSDALMRRTAGRPLPSRKIGLATAWVTVGLLGAGGLCLLGLGGAGPLLLGLGVVIIYNGLYTPLKKITAFAVLLGGFSGSAPVLIGWLAAGGNLTDFPALCLALVLYLWQVPHFWLLAARHSQDYRLAGFALPDHLGKSSRAAHPVWLGCLGVAMLLSSAFAPSGSGIAWLVPLALLLGLCATGAGLIRAGRHEFALLNACLGLFLAALSLNALLIRA